MAPAALPVPVARPLALMRPPPWVCAELPKKRALEEAFGSMLIFKEKPALPS